MTEPLVALVYRRVVETSVTNTYAWNMLCNQPTSSSTGNWFEFAILRPLLLHLSGSYYGDSSGSNASIQHADSFKLSQLLPSQLQQSESYPDFLKHTCSIEHYDPRNEPACFSRVNSIDYDIPQFLEDPHHPSALFAHTRSGPDVVMIMRFRSEEGTTCRVPIFIQLKAQKKCNRIAKELSRLKPSEMYSTVENDYMRNTQGAYRDRLMSIVEHTFKGCYLGILVTHQSTKTVKFKYEAPTRKSFVWRMDSRSFLPHDCLSAINAIPHAREAYLNDNFSDAVASSSSSSSLIESSSSSTQSNYSIIQIQVPQQTPEGAECGGHAIANIAFKFNQRLDIVKTPWMRSQDIENQITSHQLDSCVFVIDNLRLLDAKDGFDMTTELWSSVLIRLRNREAIGLIINTASDDQVDNFDARAHWIAVYIPQNVFARENSIEVMDSLNNWEQFQNVYKDKINTAVTALYSAL